MIVRIKDKEYIFQQDVTVAFYLFVLCLLDYYYVGCVCCFGICSSAFITYLLLDKIFGKNFIRSKYPKECGK